MLESKCKIGRNCAHYLTNHIGYGIEYLKFIINHAPSGIAILETKDINESTPLDLASDRVKAYFTPQKIREIGLQNELDLVLSQEKCDNDSLVSLVLLVKRSK